jgi:hypothetical protein
MIVFNHVYVGCVADELFGDFEDLETGEKFAGKNLDDDEDEEEEEKDKAEGENGKESTDQGIKLLYIIAI